MKVRDCYQRVTPEVDLVRTDTSIEDVIEIIAKNPASRSVYVLDENEELVGTISVREVLNILGAKYLKKRSIAVLHEILAQTASDIMKDAESVSLDDDLEDALKVAVVHGLEDLPVLEGGKVVGNLDCFELIKGIKESHAAERDKKQ
ncbi:MAG: CBS domain-containing protein [Candidatus Abyssobacteria bacterium SURF_17]|jgi:CBS domain-containing protein|uniref:CBS domain-containing protein n=1 Tax=Candidatus Abyssobacteria bacterium SURF_17 TaxID=2093361 RepID=A0A419EU02_9BACT|nr:MAG: CBS domain-containing protein [Candidatus Abyssubacteria bacterium SURF_17]